MRPSETLTVKGKYADVESSPLPLQRALLSSVVSRKCGPSTPVPSWKVSDMPSQGMAEALTLDANPRRLIREMAARQSGCPRSTVSARKLAAALWDMQVTSKPSRNQSIKNSKLYLQTCLSRGTEGRKGLEDSAKQANVRRNHLRFDFEDKEGSSKQLKSGKRSLKESKSRSQVLLASPTAEAPQPTLVDGSHLWGEHVSTLSTELVKVLNQIWSLEEQHNESSALVTSLRSKLQKTKSRIKELQKEQSSYREDLDVMNKKVSDEKKMWMEQAEEAVLSAIKSYKEELNTERKSKVKLEAKQRKLSKEINEARKTLTKTVQDFEREKKARELMEDVCDELAREFGEDKAQVEELKRQSAKYREEVEQERRMLQMAEVWREERVHMKLAEARFELEEKNNALDKLRSELEAFIKAKRSFNEGNKDRGKNDVSNSDEAFISALHTAEQIQGESHLSIEKRSVDSFFEDQESEGIVALEDEDSPDDDLHSIELTRASCSGSQVFLHSPQPNNSKSEPFANIRRSMHEASFQSPMNAATNLKHGKVSNLVLDRIISSSGKDNLAQSITNEIPQDVNYFMSGVQPARVTKDWDLGKQPSPWSSEALPRFWHDSIKNNGMLYTQGRSHFGQTDSLLRSGSEAQSNGATFQAGLGLNLQGRNGIEQVDSTLRYGVEARGPTHGIHSKLEVFDLPRDYSSLESHNSVDLFSSGGQVATYPCSPTRKWAHSLLSVDPAESTKVNEPFESVGEILRDNSLKARLLEAKLESQQARARDSKLLPAI